MQSDGTYVQRKPKGGGRQQGSQQTFIQLASEREKLARQHKKGKGKKSTRRKMR